MRSHSKSANKEVKDKPQWVIWNGAAGLLTMATIGRVEVGADGRWAWLDRPLDMVGPINIDELETSGRIAFAACLIMSRQRWQDDQVELRREAHAKRRAAQERLNEEYARFFNGGWEDWNGDSLSSQRFDEQQHRETLNLPSDGKLEPAQINKAYRRLAQKHHPDMGGSHEQFVRITEARDALLDRV